MLSVANAAARPYRDGFVGHGVEGVISGSVAIDRSYIEIAVTLSGLERLPVEVAEARRRDHDPVVVGPCPPHAEVVLEVLCGQVRRGDLRDVLVGQPAAGVCVHGDQLVLAEDQRVEAGVGEELAELGYRPTDRLGQIR